MPSSPGTENATVTELALPQILSGRGSPISNDDHQDLESIAAKQKKKKKKRSKKSSTAKIPTTEDATNTEGRSPVLNISRNKHWKYISSYHGPWLQLPLELLDTLLTVNFNRSTMISSVLPHSTGPGRRYPVVTGDHVPPESTQASSHAPLLLHPPPFSKPNISARQIDPGVFKSVLYIRRLIDEASELSVRAASRLSSAELSSIRSASSLNANSWTSAHPFGINPLGNTTGGRSVPMSTIRIHRLRTLAVQRLAQAYKTDEVASSVMIMQGGSVFDDLAERVLKVDQDNVDAKYVHFFHEKIPSRQLAESTTTKVLDELIATYPQRLEYYRTRGIVHCFRDEYAQAIKDFTFAIKETRSRKAKLTHHESLSSKVPRQGKRRKGKAAHQANGQAPAEGTSVMENDLDSSDKEHVTHLSSLEDIPDSHEPQLLFFRGATYLQQAIHLIEVAILEIEEIEKTFIADGVELRLRNIENGKYGGVEMSNPEGPLGRRDGPKLQAYASTLGEKSFKDHISQLLKRGMRDHEKFQSHFDLPGQGVIVNEGDMISQLQHAYQTLEANQRHGKDSHNTSKTWDGTIFATYHPLLIESLFSVLICQLMLADFEAVLPLFIRTAAIAEFSEGYPVFLPPRSMSQAEFIEVLERLSQGWKNGIQSPSLSYQRGKGRVVIAERMTSTISQSTISSSPSVSRDNSYNELDVAESSSSRLGNGSIDSQQSLNEVVMTFESAMRIPSEGPSVNERRQDAAEALNCARMLLAPVAKRQRDLAQAEKAVSKSTMPPPISIPLHGPKVEIILAWLGAVHLPELDG